MSSLDYPWSVSDLDLRITYNPRASSSTPPAPKTPSAVERLASEAAQLAQKGKDASAITRAIDEVEAERRRIVEKALKGALDIAKLGSVKSRRFRLTYHSKGGVHTAEGVEFPDERTGKEDYRNRVFLGEMSHGIAVCYASMKKLRESLDAIKIVHLIDYID